MSDDNNNIIVYYITIMLLNVRSDATVIKFRHKRIVCVCVCVYNNIVCRPIHTHTYIRYYYYYYSYHGAMSLLSKSETALGGRISRVYAYTLYSYRNAKNLIIARRNATRTSWTYLLDRRCTAVFRVT